MHRAVPTRSCGILARQPVTSWRWRTGTHRPATRWYGVGMPELPDICAYLHALEQRIVGRELQELQVMRPFFLRSVEPPLPAVAPRGVTGLRRLGKRIVIGLDGDLWLVIHLMIAGRLQWRETPAPSQKPGRNLLARLTFDCGQLSITEAGSKKRASLYIVQGCEALAEHDPGGLEVLDCGFDSFRDRITRQNRTLKRVLTDPRILSGIGNAYSDEILHAARMSPVTLTHKLDDAALRRLFEATRSTLTTWRERLVCEAASGFPKKVTAFRPEMAVHGRYQQPCPECGTPVQRIRYASNETHYCPTCQTGGRLLADRALSRLLKQDWPRTVDELEAL